MGVKKDIIKTLVYAVRVKEQAWKGVKPESVVLGSKKRFETAMFINEKDIVEYFSKNKNVLKRMSKDNISPSKKDLEKIGKVAEQI